MEGVDGGTFDAAVPKPIGGARVNSAAPGRRYRCSELSEAEAYELLRQGHSYLDADGDGRPCEWGRNTSATRPSGGINCYYVGGYTRKNGTYVRGHRRCR
ncbi:excalibur calcium-binding domain-containing protein [Alcanivorax quisquiliarum]|uniref:excalibur calcium-binding domain-containing protein n=1 Tax=Alcanivorax quisquiliarum TaxID=2933565 RepID=UPI00352FBE8B